MGGVGKVEVDGDGGRDDLDGRCEVAVAVGVDFVATGTGVAEELVYYQSIEVVLIDGQFLAGISNFPGR